MTDTIPLNHKTEHTFIKTTYEDLTKKLKEPNNADIIKRISLSIAIAITGSIFLIGFVITGLRILIEAGVSEKTIMMSVGVGVILLGVASSISACRLIGRILWRNAKHEVKKGNIND